MRFLRAIAPRSLRRQTARHGVTLIEALIAVALLAALVVTLSPAIASAVRVSTRLGAAATAAEDERSADDLLRGVFGSVVQFETDAPPYALAGDGCQIILTILRAGEDVPETARLAIARDAVDVVLTPITAGRASAAGASARLRWAEALRFEYYGTASSDAPPTWRSEWKAQTAPQLVRVVGRRGRAEFEVGGQIPIACAFDPISRRCR